MNPTPTGILAARLVLSLGYAVAFFLLVTRISPVSRWFGLAAAAGGLVFVLDDILS